MVAFFLLVACLDWCERLTAWATGGGSLWRSALWADYLAVLGLAGNHPKLAVLRRLRQRMILCPTQPAFLSTTEALVRGPSREALDTLSTCVDALQRCVRIRSDCSEACCEILGACKPMLRSRQV